MINKRKTQRVECLTNKNSILNKKEQGMTLVVLVVTIIILLILAGVAINMALGDNGLFKKSKEAVNIWKSAENNETGVLGYLDRELDSLMNGGTGSGNPSKDPNDPPKPQGPVTTGDVVDDIVLPENTETPTTVTIGGEEVIVPPKFTIAKDSGKTVSEGIVVVDPQGNEWVWVPCYVPEGKGSDISGQIEYARYTFKNQTLNKANNGICQTDYGTGQFYEKQPLTETSLEYLSIKQYGGYYIGRYEAGDKDLSDLETPRFRTSSDKSNHIVSIMKNQVPYNYVTQAQGVALSEGMTSADGSDTNKLDGRKVFTKLCSSYSWDTAIKFMEKTHPTYGSTSETCDGIVSYETRLIETGKSYAICSIYDMRGNLKEYSTESYTQDSSYCGIRGADRRSDMIFPVSRRCPVHSGVTADYIGFRPTLFIKAV